MRATLLNNDGFCGLEDVEFPVEVEVYEVVGKDDLTLIRVSTEELRRIGADMQRFEVLRAYSWVEGSGAVLL